MKKNFELIKNTIIIFIGKASTQLISFLLLPIYTRYLSTDEYGLVDLIVTYVTLLVPVIALQLEMASFRFLIDSRKNIQEQKKIISSISFMLLILVSVFLLIYIPFTIFIDFKFKHIIILNILSTLLYSVLLQTCRGFGDNISYSIASCISGIVNVVLSIVFVIILKYGGLGVLLATCIGNLIASLYMIYKSKLISFINKKSISKDKSKELLKYSVPLIPDSISWWIVNASDRTIVSIILSVAENGIYAVANKFSTIYTGVFNVFSLSWNESLSVHIDEEDVADYINNTYDYIFNFFFGISLIIICVIPLIGSLFITNDYIEAYMHIPILMIAAFFNVLSTFLSAIYFAKKETKKIAKTSLFGAFVNIIVNLCLIKFVGLYAASISTLIAYLFLFIYRYFDIKKMFDLNLFKKDKIFSFIFSIVVIIFYYLNITWLNYINILLLMIVLFTINMNKIKKIFLILRKKLKRKE